VTKALALEEVSFGYGAEPILDHLTLSVAEGEILVLLGPSGGGKSTVLRLLLGFAAPASGRVEVGGALVSAGGEILVPPEERNLAVVFQDLALWPHLTVRGNLAFGLDSRRVAKATQEERIREILGRVGLTDKERRHPGELSGGERQRAAIARALVLEPRAILLDEPLANLDAHRKRQLMGMFREIFKERKTTALYVSHDLREAAALADRIAVLENGRVVQEGTLDDLRARPATEFVTALIDDLVWAAPR
jgi:ABC-type Fe3+/spermidine/putrescine transport system ATPase subunit